MERQYSVLMSVYEKERAEYLQAALQSIINQTLPPYEIILVCDGSLTAELEQVLKDYSQYLTVVRREQSGGLGSALAAGLQYCRCEWIARMDSDDIAANTRCEKQMCYIQKNPETDILSGALAEFYGDAMDENEASQKVLSVKCLPATNQEIAKYIQYRNPINHPCVMFRKKKVLEAGNYQSCLLFEDYDLWVRMYLKQCIFANLNDIILYMRVNDMHRRRGGFGYAKAVAVFWSKMYQRRMISIPQYLGSIVLRVTVSLLPNQVRKMIYDIQLRNY